MKAGLKQSLRTIKQGMAKRVFIAKDSDAYVIRKVIELAQEKGLEIKEVETMKELGKMSGIDIGTAVAVELK